MKSETEPTFDQSEPNLHAWEKWLFASFGAALIMLLHALLKAFENKKLTSAFFFIEEKLGRGEVAGFTANPPGYNEYLGDIFFGMHSPLRVVFGAAVVLLFILLAVILAYHRKWRSVPLSKRMDLIFGFLLAGWVTLLSFGVQDPLNVGGSYSVLVIVYMLGMGLGYWWLRRRKDRAEEVFP